MPSRSTGRGINAGRSEPQGSDCESRMPSRLSSLTGNGTRTALATRRRLKATPAYADRQNASARLNGANEIALRNKPRQKQIPLGLFWPFDDLGDRLQKIGESDHGHHEASAINERNNPRGSKTARGAQEQLLSRPDHDRPGRITVCPASRKSCSTAYLVLPYSLRACGTAEHEVK